MFQFTIKPFIEIPIKVTFPSGWIYEREFRLRKELTLTVFHTLKLAEMNVAYLLQNQ